MAGDADCELHNMKMPVRYRAAHVLSKDHSGSMLTYLSPYLNMISVSESIECMLFALTAACVRRSSCRLTLYKLRTAAKSWEQVLETYLPCI
jgi:hypothetical protein